ncbi:MAG: hypothetical protein IT365_16015 [Candidatus Hydrogenedentes bacterium]|nr:hypothetical protein [Candidatus Hydrogenedentota bacterium]
MAKHVVRVVRKTKHRWAVLRVLVLTALLSALGLIATGCPPVVLYGPVPVYGVPTADALDR